MASVSRSAARRSADGHRRTGRVQQRALRQRGAAGVSEAAPAAALRGGLIEMSIPESVSPLVSRDLAISDGSWGGASDYGR